MGIVSGNILVVDDTKENLRILVDALGNEGYKIRPALNGQIALEAARKETPDLILLDIIMPGMDGYQVCDALKADKGLKDVPVIFISALGEVGDKVKGFSAGGVDYISKPFQMEEVLARVETHLTLRHLRKELEEKNTRLQQTNEQLKEEIEERKRAEEALKESERELRIRGQINNIFLTLPDEKMYAEVLKVILNIMKSKYGTFGYFDEDESFVAPAVTRKIFWDKCNVPEKDIIFRKGTFGGIWGKATKERKTLIDNDGPFDTPQGHIPINNTMVTPIIFRDELISAIHVANKPGGYGEKDRVTLEAIAGQIAPVLYARVQRDKQDRERKEANEALRESNENLDKAQKIAHIGNWSRDLNLDRAQWSDEMYRILGLTSGDPAEISYEFFLSRIHPEDRERVTSVLKEAAEKKKPFDFEFRTIPIKGSERIIRNRGEVEYDETGAPVRLFGTDQDITETKKLQAQVQESQKIEAISTIAGGIAHNFNNALTPIIGNVDLLEMTHGNDEKTMKSLKDIKTSGLRMVLLTSQLLAYAKGGKYNPQVQSLSDFVDATLPLIQHTLDSAVRVETDLPLDLMNVKADTTQMQMVLSAIMANSNEAMEDPGRIRISTRNIDLDQGFIKDHPGIKPGPYVCLSIEDDGKGMDEETKSKIFDPFFTTHFMGRGLGMASVYGIVKNHDGAITVDSELGKGTVVRIYLPAIEAEEKSKKVVVSKPELELPKGDATILVIEDEEQVMMLIRQVLETFGYRVVQAETGKEAIKLAKTFEGQIDLAILDIKLPDMTGDKVYPLIMEARPDLKVIVCSGYGIEGPPQDVLDAGAEGFVQKPFHIATLAEKLKEVLEG